MLRLKSVDLQSTGSHGHTELYRNPMTIFFTELKLKVNFRSLQETQELFSLVSLYRQSFLVLLERTCNHTIHNILRDRLNTRWEECKRPPAAPSEMIFSDQIFCGCRRLELQKVAKQLKISSGILASMRFSHSLLRQKVELDLRIETVFISASYFLKESCFGIFGFPATIFSPPDLPHIGGTSFLQKANYYLPLLERPPQISHFFSLH